MSSRDLILRRLRESRRPFTNVADTPETYIPMVPMATSDRSVLKARFIAEAEKLAAIVHEVPNTGTAVEAILEIVGDDSSLITWDTKLLPVPDFSSILTNAGIQQANPNDPEVRIGISGADAGLAATGSLVLSSGKGKYRNASLLPPVHIAILTTAQILPDMESWIANQSTTGPTTLRDSSNIVIISGASRTADIAMELILGMHGPRELHIILIEDNESQ